MLPQMRFFLALLFMFAFAAGCAEQNYNDASMLEATPTVNSPPVGFSFTGAELPGTEPIARSLARVKDFFAIHNTLLASAQSALGTPYVRGGTTLRGFDCSGFVQWAYKQVGVTLPRTAREQARVGQLITRQKDLCVGDIVAFRHPRRGYHTGIYIGDGKFIHSPRTRSVVRISSLQESYFRKTYLGARRLPLFRELTADTGTFLRKNASAPQSSRIRLAKRGSSVLSPASLAAIAASSSSRLVVVQRNQTERDKTEKASAHARSERDRN